MQLGATYVPLILFSTLVQLINYLLIELEVY